MGRTYRGDDEAVRAPSAQDVSSGACNDDSAYTLPDAPVPETLNQKLEPRNAESEA